ncbi:MAG: SCO family protein [Planctomycetota bacterium]|nr:MAG: SCO family protein [Planctomycetota bacterium]
MPSPIRPLAILALCSGVLALGSFAAMRSLRAGVEPGQAPDPLAPDPGMDALSIPPFALTAQDGRPVSEADLVGGVTIMDFFFSRCPFICPPMSRNMRRCQDELAGTGVRLLSVSVDPEHDTPERLADYARDLGADPRVWTFATGPIETVSRILTEGLMLAPPTPSATQRITFADGGSMANIAHPSHFVLIGPGGEILGLYSGLDGEQVGALIERARAASVAVAP